MLTVLKEQLQRTLQKSLKNMLPQGDIPDGVALEIPNDKSHGEFSCNIALRLARSFKKNPLDLAGEITHLLEKEIANSGLQEKIEKIEVKKPGFINFFLSKNALYDILYQVFKEGADYGRRKSKKKQKIQIEFVSANPTGPLSVAHARQAAVGDVLGNILLFLGHDVKKEYYINDEGNQINLLGKSITIRAKEMLEGTSDKLQTLEEGCYQGEYIRDIAREFIAKKNIKNKDELKTEETDSKAAQFGVKYILNTIKKDLSDFGVHFDVWSSQSKIATPKNIENVIAFLRTKGLIYDKEGAVWFKSSHFGDDKDRVVKKTDGAYTYLAPDIVYHRHKFERGFTELINIWGPDHHGYIPRIKAAAQALGHEADDLQVLIVQLATIYKDGKPLSMSTRRGQYISLREVIDEVGVDAARFFFLMRHIKAHLDFDLELAKKETPENPVYYIQYAHARIHSIIKFSKDEHIKPKHKGLALLKEEEELDILRKIGNFGDVLSICEQQLDPFALTVYLLELATCFHKFYDRHRVIGEDQELSTERFALIEATKTVLANGLRLLGVSVPEQM